ncbi:unnamed protein product [Penicillium nalgiovense]|nr:unnamed protein product [Penicillium nalgiovense]
MLALKDSCLHPTSQQPYIKSASGGKDNSPESIQVSGPRFTCAADRDYYVQSDPVHFAFVESLDGLLEKAQVVYFTDGAF